MSLKYYKWKIHFDLGSNYGTSPTPSVYQGSSWTEGAFQEGLTIYGYGDSDLNTTEYSKWNLEEISQAEILSKFNELHDLDCSIGEDGKIIMPRPDGSV